MHALIVFRISNGEIFKLEKRILGVGCAYQIQKLVKININKGNAGFFDFAFSHGGTPRKIAAQLQIAHFAVGREGTEKLTVIFKIIGEIFHKLCLNIKYFGGGGENIFSLQG